MAGVLPQQVSGSADTQINDPSDDTVAIIDGEFGSEEAHGDAVAYVVEANSSTRSGQIRKLKIGGERPPPELKARVDHFIAGLLNDTSGALEKILESPGKIQVVNESLGFSQLDVVMNIWREKGDLFTGVPSPESLKELAGQIGMDPRELDAVKDPAALEKKVFQALVQFVDKTARESPVIQQARKRYEGLTEKLEQKGIFLVLAAGNEGEKLNELKSKGYVLGEDFTRSPLFIQRGNVIVVGASTGKESGGEDRIADFSTPSQFVTVATDGTDIPVGANPEAKATGTSYAAPQVAALIAEMHRNGFSPEEVRSTLIESARDTSAPREQEGRGIIDMQQTKPRIQQRTRERSEEPQRPRQQSPLMLRLPVRFSP